jgi:hypothetical protein
VAQSQTETWIGVCLEILQRINQQSFVMANAYTTGRRF